MFNIEEFKFVIKNDNYKLLVSKIITEYDRLLNQYKPKEIIEDFCREYGVKLYGNASELSCYSVDMYQIMSLEKLTELFVFIAEFVEKDSYIQLEFPDDEVIRFDFDGEKVFISKGVVEIKWKESVSC